MVPSPKVIGEIADILEEDFKEIGIGKECAVNVEASTLNDYCSTRGLFCFNIAYQKDGKPKKDSILLPNDKLKLPSKDTKESCVQRYNCLVEVMAAVASEIKERGYAFEFNPVPFDEATFAKVETWTGHIYFGSQPGNLAPHSLHPKHGTSSRRYHEYLSRNRGKEAR